MLALTHGLLSVAASSSVAATHWRVNITLTQTSDSFYAHIAELQLRTSPGGPNVATGGSPSAGSSWMGTPPAPPANAFDGNNATSWVSDTGVLPASGLIWLAYQLPSALDIAEIAITAGDSPTRALRAPSNFLVQRSSDGAHWTTVWSVAGSTGWGVSETRVFTRT